MGIRTPETALTVYTISNRAPSASSDTSPRTTLIIITKKSVKVKTRAKNLYSLADIVVCKIYIFNRFGWIYRSKT